jgi:predicted signal transduction protein with EAL and GGDEF domain
VQTEACTRAIGVAIGAALVPRDGDTVEKVLRHADVAMYQAKQKQGTTLVVFSGLAPAEARPVQAAG